MIAGTLILILGSHTEIAKGTDMNIIQETNDIVLGDLLDDDSFLDIFRFIQKDNDLYYCICYALKQELVISDPINPPYYTWHPIAPAYKISQEFDGNLAQAIQYIYRSGCPGNTKHVDITEDLRKAIRFLEFEIERLNHGKV